jgi:outer membrane protein OmpA-like peptidoglycan-associated protein
MSRQVLVASVLALSLAASSTVASAQTGSLGTSTGQNPSTQQSSSTEDTTEETRPATTTFHGDTGLWFVPTAEVLAHGKWSVTGYRRGTNYIQGYTNVADFAGTFAVGIGNRAEIFTSFLVDTRIDRDVRPIFVPNNTEFGSFLDRYPRVHQIWTGDNVGDWFLGGKVNLLSEFRQSPAALAVRGVLKIPTGDEEVGNGTGKADFFVDFIGSKDLAQMVEVSGYAGYEWRGEPDGFQTPGGAFRWGAGAGFPTRSPVRIYTELNGWVGGDDGASRTERLVGVDGSVAPLLADTTNQTRAHVGINYQHRRGFFIGTGLAWSLPKEGRLEAFSEDNDSPFGDYWDWQVRIGYHPGVRVYVPPPPPAPPAPPPAPVVHNLTVDATANPPTVQIGQPSTVTATVQSSINCAVTYRWSAPSGTFANPTARETVWTAGQDAATVPITVTVTCPTDNRMASDTVNVTVTRPTPKVYTFEDVHFDFDRYSLRPEATRVLDEAVTALREDPTLRIQIEGHTCNIGTAEYNLALGDRRANGVRDYLTSRGVTADRLSTVSYGEERPKHDNTREETRRLNRRAALTVNLQK